MSFIAIDFEASCLPHHGRSFPIEVGIASPLGWSKSWLIKPHADWQGWQWSGEAEALHGLTLRRLDREGLDVREVARRLRLAVAGHEVIADSYLDDAWSRTLYSAAGEERHLPVRCLADLKGFMIVDPDRLTQAIAQADLQRKRKHRAEEDARWLVRMLGQLGLDDVDRLVAAKAA